MTAVAASGLSKRYRSGALALDGLDLTIEEGEVFGLLGPNGAGKTTFVKLLLGLIAPTAGWIRIFGKSPEDPSSRIGIGFAPESPRFQDFLSGAEVLRFHTRLIGLSRQHAEAQIRRLLEQADLAGAPKRVSAYSKGMIRRLALAQAYLGDPQLLILDEPTADLDPIGRRSVRDQLLNFKQKGGTVILNSHLLSEVEKVCDKVAIVHKGRLLAAGSIQDVAPQDQDLETVFIDLIKRSER